MADALISKVSSRKGVRVQIPVGALIGSIAKDRTMAFKSRHENDRFDHSKCSKCGTVFAGVYSFDKHRPCPGLPLALTQMGFTVMNDLVIAEEKTEAYAVMLHKAETARAGRK
jgi:hypothetical protein